MRLAGFTVLSPLGAGAFGQVVLARHDGSGTIVAIKYLYERNPAARAWFRHEAAMVRQVASPHVARLYEFIEQPDGAAIVMEAVPGVPLTALLADGVLSAESALAVLKGSLLGLAAAHQAGVVHRDYKPGNVLVQPNCHSKLVDFGLATLAGQAGTPTYLAPEQWNGAPATPATDVYAATCVFFHCVTGHPPFAGDLRTHHEHAPVPVDLVPPSLRPLVARGMAKHPQERPPTAWEFVAHLESLAATGFGPDWESRGWEHLAGKAATLLSLTPLAALADTDLATGIGAGAADGTVGAGATAGSTTAGAVGTAATTGSAGLAATNAPVAAGGFTAAGATAGGGGATGGAPAATGAIGAGATAGGAGAVGSGLAAGGAGAAASTTGAGFAAGATGAGAATGAATGTGAAAAGGAGTAASSLAAGGGIAAGSAPAATGAIGAGATTGSAGAAGSSLAAGTTGAGFAAGASGAGAATGAAAGTGAATAGVGTTVSTTVGGAATAGGVASSAVATTGAGAVAGGGATAAIAAKVVIGVIAAAAVAGTTVVVVKAASGDSSGAPPARPRVTAAVQTRSENLSSFTFNGQVVRVTGIVDQGIANRVNQVLAKPIDDWIAYTQQGLEAAAGISTPTGTPSASSQAHIVGQTDRVVSVRYDLSIEDAGDAFGNHGGFDVVGMSIDLTTGTQVTAAQALPKAASTPDGAAALDALFTKNAPHGFCQSEQDIPRTPLQPEYLHDKGVQILYARDGMQFLLATPEFGYPMVCDVATVTVPYPELKPLMDPHAAALIPG